MRRVPVRIRLFLTSLLIFLMPVLMLGSLGLNWATAVLQKNAVDSLSGTLKNVADRMDGGIANMDDTVVQISRDSLIYRITWMRGDALDTSRVSMNDIIQYKNELTFVSATADLYEKIALCFPRKQLAVSMLGPWKLSYFLQDEFRVSGMDEEDWQTLFAEKDVAYLPQRAMSTFGYQQYGLLCSRVAERDGKGNCLLAILFWVDNSVLESYFDDLLLYPGTVTEAYDESGEMVFRHGEPPADEEGLILLSRESAATGWRYLAYIPEAEVLAVAQPFRDACYAIFAAVLLLGGAMAFELAQVNYRPFARILKMLNANASEESAEAKGDMERAEIALSEILTRQAELKSRVEESRDLIRYAALSHMLEGDAKAVPGETMAMLEMPLPHPYFTVGVVDGPYPEGLDAMLAACREAGMRAYTLRAQGRLTILINHAGAGDARTLSWNGETIGVSRPRDDAREIPAAASEAYRASRFRPIRPGTGVVFYEDIEHGGQMYYYPRESEQKLSGALCVGDAEGALQCFEALVARNTADGMSDAALSRLTAAVYLTALRTDDAGGAIETAINALDPPLSDAPEAQTEYARSVLRAAAACSLRQVGARKSEFLTKVQFYIDEHLTDPALSLGMVAEAFGLTSAYLSRYFKEQTQIGYLDYVNKKRVEMAKRLLSAGECTVKGVAEEVGFQSDATFRRLYKKYEGITPSQEQTLRASG